MLRKTGSVIYNEDCAYVFPTARPPRGRGPGPTPVRAAGNLRRQKSYHYYILLYIDITTVNSTVQLEKKAARSGLRPIPGQGRFPGPA